jgi:3-dehydro-4-phosphotetronate decarboxylase
VRDEIVETGRSLYLRGLSPGTSGNLSVRTGDGFLMTPTNASLGALDPAALSVLDTAGNHVAGHVPTKEAWLHLALYAVRDDAQAIVHLHSTHAVAVACLADIDEDDVLPPLTPYSVMRVGRLPLVPYGRPGDDSLAGAVRERARTSGALLLANHGPIVAAATLGQAAAACEEIEETAKLMLLTHGMRRRLLTAQQVDELRE